MQRLPAGEREVTKHMACPPTTAASRCSYYLLCKDLSHHSVVNSRRPAYERPRKIKEDQRRARQTRREGAIDVDVHTIQSLEFPDGIMAPTHCHLFSYLEDHLSSSARFSMSTLKLWIITFSLKNWPAVEEVSLAYLKDNFNASHPKQPIYLPWLTLSFSTWCEVRS